MVSGPILLLGLQAGPFENYRKERSKDAIVI